MGFLESIFVRFCRLFQEVRRLVGRKNTSPARHKAYEVLSIWIIWQPYLPSW